MCNRSKFADATRELQSFLVECVEDVEGLLGPRESGFHYPQVRVCKVEGPYTDVSKPPNLSVIIPERSLGSGDLTEAQWHVAHESVHVLDPHTNPTSYLEEGLATWFQNRKVSKYSGAQFNPWHDAMKRVKPWIEKGLLTGIKRFRQEQAYLRQQGKPSRKLGDITEQMLVFHCPAVGMTAWRLVEAFPERPNPEVV